MKQKFKIYLYIFLSMTIGFAGISIVIDLILGDGLDWFGYLFTSIFFGFFMSLFLSSSAIRKLKKAGKDIEDFAKIPETQSVITQCNLEEIKDILAKDYIFKNSDVKINENSLKFSKGWSWDSWGENLSIRQLSKTDDGFEYEITSRPKFKLTLVDYGKNYANVKHIKSILSPLPNEEQA